MNWQNKPNRKFSCHRKLGSYIPAGTQTGLGNWLDIRICANLESFVMVSHMHRTLLQQKFFQVPSRGRCQILLGEENLLQKLIWVVGRESPTSDSTYLFRVETRILREDLFRKVFILS